MAKLGMPSVVVKFVEAGIEAIQRSQRGIVGLILEDTKVSITKLGQKTEQHEALKNPFIVYTVDDIPAELSEKNKDYILKALKGYNKPPLKIVVYMMETVQGGGADKFQDPLKAMLTERFDYLAIPTIETAQLEYLGTWVKTARENKFKKVKVVLPNYPGDFEGVVNFANTKVVTADREYKPAEYTARIAGLIAGTNMTQSATYAPLNEVIDCDRYTQDEMNQMVNEGKFFIWFDGEKFKMSRAVNSLVTTSQGKLEGFQTMKIVDIMDMMYDDIKKTAEDSYIGKYTNDYENKCLLISAIMGYFKQLENERLLQKGYSTCEIDTEAVRTYQLSHGLYTKEELAKMSDEEVKRLDTKKIVFLKAKVRPLDAMEDIQLPISI
jgi:phage tail sheath protein|nr:MAG TPA: tail protein [Caudoviricetes sp.]